VFAADPGVPLHNEPWKGLYAAGSRQSDHTDRGLGGCLASAKPSSFGLFSQGSSLPQLRTFRNHVRAATGNEGGGSVKNSARGLAQTWKSATTNVEERHGTSQRKSALAATTAGFSSGVGCGAIRTAGDCGAFFSSPATASAGGQKAGAATPGRSKRTMAPKIPRKRESTKNLRKRSDRK